MERAGTDLVDLKSEKRKKIEFGEFFRQQASWAVAKKPKPKKKRQRKGPVSERKITTRRTR